MKSLRSGGTAPPQLFRHEDERLRPRQLLKRDQDAWNDLSDSIKRWRASFTILRALTSSC